jgi:hypothetical protein
LDRFIPTFGTATTPKHWHVLVYSLSKGITGGTNKKTKESEKEGPFYPLYSSLPLLLNGNSPKMPMLFGLRLHQGWEYNNLEPRDGQLNGEASRRRRLAFIHPTRTHPKTLSLPPFALR